jgi:hypothetical protein
VPETVEVQMGVNSVVEAQEQQEEAQLQVELARVALVVLVVQELELLCAQALLATQSKVFRPYSQPCNALTDLRCL